MVTLDLYYLQIFHEFHNDENICSMILIHKRNLHFFMCLFIRILHKISFINYSPHLPVFCRVAKLNILNTLQLSLILRIKVKTARREIPRKIRFIIFILF